MKNNPLPRLDSDEDTRNRILPLCRLQQAGQVWVDPSGRHRVACGDAANRSAVRELVGAEKVDLAVQDPPYNLVAFEQRDLTDYVRWCRQWVENTFDILKADGSLYVWIGADQRNGFQPLPDFMLMMRDTAFRPRSFLTMRNQRGYGTQKNWMAVRQELLYYVIGDPYFDIAAEYTDIPKILRGYYKEVSGERTENLERSHSDTIRAGNVWVDIQQVFYRMDENVSGCYAQKPLKAISRIIKASCPAGGLVLDLFAHSGTTLLSAESQGRRCFTMDIDPVYCEITIRRLEHFRNTGHLGWQNSHCFEGELQATTQSGEAADTPSAPGRSEDGHTVQRQINLF